MLSWNRRPEVDGHLRGYPGGPDAPRTAVAAFGGL